jgi:hypothetical protein
MRQLHPSQFFHLRQMIDRFFEELGEFYNSIKDKSTITDVEVFHRINTFIDTSDNTSAILL